MPSGIFWLAKTARPADGVSRISKYRVEGAPVGRSFDGSAGGAEDDEDGRDVLYAEEAGVERRSSEGYIMNDRRPLYDSALMSVTLNVLSCENEQSTMRNCCDYAKTLRNPPPFGGVANNLDFKARTYDRLRMSHIQETAE